MVPFASICLGDFLFEQINIHLKFHLKDVITMKLKTCVKLLHRCP